MNEDDWYNKIRQISGVQDKYNQYADYYQQKRYEYDRAEKQSVSQEQMHELSRQIAEMVNDMKKKMIPTKTHEEKMNEKIFSLNDICALIDALSLGISDPAEREALDKMVRNWRDDRLKEI
jgi:hypothetical protein